MRRGLAALAGGVTALLLVAGCGSSGTGDSGGTNGGIGGIELTAAQVLQKAAEKTKAVDSYKAQISMKVASKEGNMTMKGQMLTRLRPTLAFDMNYTQMDMGGQSLPGGMRMKLIGKTMYMKMGALSQMTGGKPWLKINLAKMGKEAGVSINELMQQARQADPYVNVQMLLASEDVKLVGKDTINGVETSHYTGTYDASQGLDKLDLDAETREMVEKMAAELKNPTFDLWVDKQQLPRRITIEADTTEGRMTVTTTLRDFNEPVQIKAPPANLVADIAKLKAQQGG